MTDPGSSLTVTAPESGLTVTDPGSGLIRMFVCVWLEGSGLLVWDQVMVQSRIWAESELLSAAG